MHAACERKPSCWSFCSYRDKWLRIKSLSFFLFTWRPMVWRMSGPRLAGSFLPHHLEVVHSTTPWPLCPNWTAFKAESRNWLKKKNLCKRCKWTATHCSNGKSTPSFWLCFPRPSFWKGWRNALANLFHDWKSGLLLSPLPKTLLSFSFPLSASRPRRSAQGLSTKKTNRGDWNRRFFPL